MNDQRPTTEAEMLSAMKAHVLGRVQGMNAVMRGQLIGNQSLTKEQHDFATLAVDVTSKLERNIKSAKPGK